MTSEPSKPPRSANSAMREARERVRILLEHVQELHVPGRVVESRPLAVHLVGQSAGADDRHLQIFRIALDRLAQRLAEIETAARGGDRKLQHADLQRHDGARPRRLVRPQQRQRRETAVVEALALEDTTCRIRPRPAPFADVRARAPGGRLIGGSLRAPPPSSATAYSSPMPSAKCRVVIEEERGDVVVEDEEQHVRLLLGQPALDRLIALEDRRPDRCPAACWYRARSRLSGCGKRQCRLRSWPSMSSAANAACRG